MNDSIVRRGPDDSGRYIRNQVGLGMRRLSIIDVAGGHQPVHNEDKTIWVVFNGEIYNYLELRRDLEKSGHRFYTQSDSETLVHLYEEYGVDGVSRLRGMFAYALWDETNDRLVLARDRIGIKPLYYAVVDGRLVFASELKAFFRAPGFTGEVNPAAIDQFLAYLYIPGPETIYRDVVELPPPIRSSINGVERRFNDTGLCAINLMNNSPSPIGKSGFSPSSKIVCEAI